MNKLVINASNRLKKWKSKKFKPGDNVRYIPSHVKGNINHLDCDDGVVASVIGIKGNNIFVRYDNDFTVCLTPENNLIHISSEEIEQFRVKKLACLNNILYGKSEIMKAIYKGKEKVMTTNIDNYITQGLSLDMLNFLKPYNEKVDGMRVWNKENPDKRQFTKNEYIKHMPINSHYAHCWNIEFPNVEQISEKEIELLYLINSTAEEKRKHNLGGIFLYSDKKYTLQEHFNSKELDCYEMICWNNDFPDGEQYTKKQFMMGNNFSGHYMIVWNREFRNTSHATFSKKEFSETKKI